MPTTHMEEITMGAEGSDKATERIVSKTAHTRTTEPTPWAIARLFGSDD